MADHHPATLGVILAGGLSRRMGGGDKSLLNLAGQPLLAHVIERLRPQCDGLLLNANGDPARLIGFDLPVVADSIPDFAGPLAGILAGLDWLAANRPAMRWLVSVAADTPLIPPNLVARLHQARAESGCALACTASAGRQHHAIGLWGVTMRQPLREALVGGERRLGAFTKSQGVAVAEWPAAPRDPFFNINTPDDLALAEAMLDAGA